MQSYPVYFHERTWSFKNEGGGVGLENQSGLRVVTGRIPRSEPSPVGLGMEGEVSRLTE